MKTFNTNIKSNKDLEILFREIRNSLNKGETFEEEKDIDIYYKTAILLFNNMEKPFWGNNIANNHYSDYFQSKNDLNFSDNIKDNVNQLFKLWHNKTTITIEYNYRGLEFLTREYNKEFDKDILKLIVEILKPFLDKLMSNANNK